MLFARVPPPPPIDFIFMKSFTKAATKKVEKTIFVLRKKWRENERGRDREKGRIRAAKPKVFIFFLLRFCQTWTKWYLITTQTRVKCVSWIHHRTILKSDKMSKKEKEKKQEYKNTRGTLKRPMEVASTFRPLYMQLSFQRAELKPANIHLPLPGKWLDTLVLNFSWFCQIFCFDLNDCCVSYLTTIFIMLQVADLFLEATKKKVNSLVSRTPRITYTVTVIETFFYHKLMYTIFRKLGVMITTY